MLIILSSKVNLLDTVIRQHLHDKFIWFLVDWIVGRAQPWFHQGLEAEASQSLDFASLSIDATSSRNRLVRCVVIQRWNHQRRKNTSCWHWKNYPKRKTSTSQKNTSSNVLLPIRAWWLCNPVSLGGTVVHIVHNKVTFKLLRSKYLDRIQYFSYLAKSSL